MYLIGSLLQMIDTIIDTIFIQLIQLLIQQKLTFNC